MGLRDLVFRRVEVQTSGGPLPVRGLSLDNIMSLFYQHGDVLNGTFQQVFGKARDGQPIDMQDALPLAIGLLTSAPAIAAEIIAMAAGAQITDPIGFAEEVALCKNLTLGEQIDALEKIAEQTFTTDMPPGKMFALVQKLLPSGTSAPASPGSP